MATMKTAARPMKSIYTEYDVLAKAIIIGDSSVGKSSLLYRYTEQDWNPHYIATIGVDFKVMTFERDSKIVKLQLWDTAGQDRFRTIVHTYYRGSHGVLLVFALDDRSSFDNLHEWLSDVQRFATNGVPIVLVGNKCDCPANQVAVSDEEAEAFAAQLGGTFIKTSARQNQGVDTAFSTLLERCLTHRIQMLAKMKPATNTLNLKAVPTPASKKGEKCAC